MGHYISPGYYGFEEIRNGTYVDKTGLIALVNSVIRTPQKLVCVSRPRRFGKSFAAKMLCAYYDNSCDSHALFDDLQIAGDPSYETHINKYSVIYVDMTAVIGAVGVDGVVSHIKEYVTAELLEAIPSLKVESNFMSTLSNVVDIMGTQFFMVIDEWDAPIREAAHDVALQRGYLEFLRFLFKTAERPQRSLLVPT